MNLSQQEKQKYIERTLDLVTGLVLIDNLKEMDRLIKEGKKKEDIDLERMAKNILDRLIKETQNSLQRNMDTIALSNSGKISAMEASARMTGESVSSIETLARKAGLPEDEIQKGKIPKDSLSEKINTNIKL